MMTTEDTPNKRAKRQQPKKRDILFVYATTENRKFIEEVRIEFGAKVSAVVNKIIEAYRTGKKLKLEPEIPDYVKKAEAWKTKNIL